MIRRSMFGAAGLALAAALTVPGLSADLHAQSLLSGQGLGLPMEPQDGRSQAMGGVRIGLPERDIVWGSAAEAAGLLAPGLVVSYQHDRADAVIGGQEAEVRTARFPLINGAFPAGERLIFTIGFGAFLDQNWATQQQSALILAGDTVTVTDRFQSLGGVGRIRGGVGYLIAPELAAGVGLDLYTGSVEMTAFRLFPEEPAPIRPSSAWNYRGLGLHGGLAWRPSEALSVSAAGSWGGTLTARAQREGDPDVEYELPLTATLGASGRLGPQLLVALTADYGGWSRLDGTLAPAGGARDTWGFGGGVEWEAPELRGRPLPVRLGARQGSLPFHAQAGTAGAEWVSERALTGGLGLVLAGGATRADAGFERGSRTGGSTFDESYWRMVFSVQVLGR